MALWYNVYMAYGTKHYHNLATKRNYIFLEDESTIRNTYTPVWWKCSRGHKFKQSYKTVKDSGKCRECYLEGKRYSEIFYHKTAKIKGLKFVGIYTGSSEDKVKWQCLTCGNKWFSIFSNILKDTAHCPICSKANNRIAEKTYITLGKKRGFTYLGGYVGNVQVKVEWECKYGHKFKSSYSKIKAGKGCPKCVGRHQHTEKEYIDLGLKHNLKLVTKKIPSRITTKVIWHCSNGHSFKRSLSVIKGGRTTCGKCNAENRRIKEEQYKICSEKFDYIAGYNGSVMDKVLWQCKDCKTEINARYADISRGDRKCTGCKENYINGVPTSLPQRVLHKQLGGKVNHKVGRYFADILLVRNNIKICVEYDGWYWHKNRQKEDKKRDKYFITKGIKVLRIKASHQIPNITDVENLINQLINTNKTYEEMILSDWGKD